MRVPTMLPYRTASVCDHCRLRRRRCDRIRPKCTSCVNQGVDCVYGQHADSQPSQLVQELMSIRERLQFITPLLEPRLQSSTLPDRTPPVGGPQNCPPPVIKSPHLMQILGLPRDLASVLHRLESAAPQIAESPVESMHAESPGVQSPGLNLSRFQNQVHWWYPVLHADFTRHFFESNAAGFPYSTKSCLFLLVASIESFGDDRPQSSRYEAALSMMPIVIQESSLTSVQCLILFSIYYACLLQPRQAYEYIQAAFLKVQPFLKGPSLAEGSPESHLLTRLYWTIYLIESEISMYLNLSPVGKTLRGQSTMVPLPTNVDMWEYYADSNSPSASSLSGNPLSRYSPTESPQSFSHISTEVNIQLVLNNYASPVTDMPSTCNGGSPHTEGTATPSNPLGSLPALDSPYNGLHSQNNPTQPMDDPICRAKYHMYEVIIHWPVIYRVIVDGSADPELLPYGPLFFESVISFLCAARTALRVCPPKTWFFCASIYIVSITTIRALEVRSLRLLAQPRIWEYIEGSVDALHSPSELSPSVQYMWVSLKNRLEMARLQKSG
ncbi:fungal specific transcription factor domain-containing protein [Aspergillus undulatus]|uniref:fungal specific transcription factor domain-containing protein n=1 Tax=Aspergillus undulatus TaxID=1810928 RepID=UPI003CCD41EE